MLRNQCRTASNILFVLTYVILQFLRTVCWTLWRVRKYALNPCWNSYELSSHSQWIVIIFIYFCYFVTFSLFRLSSNALDTTTGVLSTFASKPVLSRVIRYASYENWSNIYVLASCIVSLKNAVSTLSLSFANLEFGNADFGNDIIICTI